MCCFWYSHITSWISIYYASTSLRFFLPFNISFTQWVERLRTKGTRLPPWKSERSRYLLHLQAIPTWHQQNHPWMPLWGSCKPNSHSTWGSTITAQAQAGSVLGQTHSLRPHSTLAAVSSNHSAGNTPILVTTPDPSDVDPKSQAAVKYLVSQVKTFDTSEHKGSNVSITDDNDSKSSNGSGNDVLEYFIPCCHIVQVLCHQTDRKSVV